MMMATKKREVLVRRITDKIERKRELLKTYQQSARTAENEKEEMHFTYLCRAEARRLEQLKAQLEVLRGSEKQVENLIRYF